jgi:hypothetical protein
VVYHACSMIVNLVLYSFGVHIATSAVGQELSARIPTAGLSSGAIRVHVMGVRSDSQCVKVGHPGTMAVVAPLRSSVVWMLLVFCSCCGTGQGRTVARTFGGLTLPPFIYGTEGWEGNVRNPIRAMHFLPSYPPPRPSTSFPSPSLVSLKL